MSSDGDDLDDPPVEGAGFRRVHPASPFLQGGLLVVALLVAAGRQAVDGSVAFGWPVLTVLVAAVGGVLLGALSWWTTRFQVGTNELRLDSGVLVRRSRRIRYARIQAVEVHQPLLARVVGMASVAVETAGAGTEATLSYLPLRQATELRGHLLRMAARERVDPIDDGVGAPADRSVDEVLHRVPSGLLLAAQLLRTGPLLSGIGATAAALGGTAAGAPLSLAVLVPGLLAVGTTVVQGFDAGYGFTVRRSAHGVWSQAGLFGVHSTALSVQRVRGLVVREPWAWRLLGWVSVEVTVAGVEVDDEDKRLVTTLLPVAQREQAERLLSQVLPGMDVGRIPTSAPPVAARWLDPLARRTLALGHDQGHVVTRRGLLIRRTDVVPRPAVQSAGLRQGPLQRRLGLATVRLHLPAGPTDVAAVHRAEPEAWGLVLSTGRAHRPC